MTAKVMVEKGQGKGRRWLKCSLRGRGRRWHITFFFFFLG